MPSSAVTLTCDSRVIKSTPVYLTRGLINSMLITLLDSVAAALDITDVTSWDLGITEDFFGATGVLAGSSTITADDNALDVTINCHTDALADLMDGKTSIQGYATLRGFDSSLVLNRIYVFPVVVLNIGFTDDTIISTAYADLVYTKAQIDYLLSQLPGGSGWEKIENKTQDIDTEEPSADKYPSEAATVTYVAGQVSTLNTVISGKVDKEAGKVLSDNNFTTAEKNKLESALTSVPDASESAKGILMLASAAEAAAGLDTGKAIVPATLKTELDKIESTLNIPRDVADLTDDDGLLFDGDYDSLTNKPTIPPDLTGDLAAKEDAANKATDFTTVDNTKFPTTQAVTTYVSDVVGDIEAALDELIGGDA